MESGFHGLPNLEKMNRREEAGWAAGSGPACDLE